MGVSTVDSVEMTLTNVSAEVTAHTVQVVPSKPEYGTRVMRRFNKVRFVCKLFC
jgi:hypothetical protein